MHIFEFAHKKLFPEWIGFASHKLLFGSEGILSYSNTIQRWNTEEGSGM